MHLLFEVQGRVGGEDVVRLLRSDDRAGAPGSGRSRGGIPAASAPLEGMQRTEERASGKQVDPAAASFRALELVSTNRRRWTLERRAWISSGRSRGPLGRSDRYTRRSRSSPRPGAPVEELVAAVRVRDPGPQVRGRNRPEFCTSIAQNPPAPFLRL